jgi:hypothetical protein
MSKRTRDPPPNAARSAQHKRKRSDRAFAASVLSSGATTGTTSLSDYSAASSTSRITPRLTVTVARPALPVLSQPPVGARWDFEESSRPADDHSGVKYVVTDARDNSVSSSSCIIRCGTYYSQDFPLERWRELRDDFGLELHRLDSRGDAFHHVAACAGCGRLDGVVYCCEECMHGDMLCRDCVLTRHDRLPLHLIEVCVIFRSGVSRTNVARRCGRMDGSAARRSTLSVYMSLLATPAARPARPSSRPPPRSPSSTPMVSIASTWTTAPAKTARYNYGNR